MNTIIWIIWKQTISITAYWKEDEYQRITITLNSNIFVEAAITSFLSLNCIIIEFSYRYAPPYWNIQYVDTCHWISLTGNCVTQCTTSLPHFGDLSIISSVIAYLSQDILYWRSICKKEKMWLFKASPNQGVQTSSNNMLTRAVHGISNIRCSVSHLFSVDVPQVE